MKRVIDELRTMNSIQLAEIICHIMAEDCSNCRMESKCMLGYSAVEQFLDEPVPGYQSVKTVFATFMGDEDDEDY